MPCLPLSACSMESAAARGPGYSQLSRLVSAFNSSSTVFTPVGRRLAARGPGYSQLYRLVSALSNSRSTVFTPVGRRLLN